MAYIDVRITFDETYDSDDDYTDYNPIAVELISSDIPKESLEGIGEAAFQSDKYTVGVSNAFLASLDGRGKVEVEW